MSFIERGLEDFACPQKLNGNMRVAAVEDLKRDMPEDTTYAEWLGSTRTPESFVLLGSWNPMVTGYMICVEIWQKWS